MEEQLQSAVRTAYRNPDTGSQNVSSALRELGAYYDSQSRYAEVCDWWHLGGSRARMDGLRVGCGSISKECGYMEEESAQPELGVDS